jgi:hypothetical protein
VLGPAARGADEPDTRKVDSDIGSGRRTYAVFVRMADQLLGDRGDYERFCKEHAGAKRRELRPTILQDLRTRADRSWGRVSNRVAELEKARGLRNVDRYWIVNGFTCDATGYACHQLAELDEVSFVYLQRGPLHQVKRETEPGQPSATPEQERFIRGVVAAWKDDSDEPFTTKGFTTSWNLTAIQADAAWNEEHVTGRGVVVAMNDSGMMLTPALTRALWKNPSEVLNGKDDDGDGRVDDVFGWDFNADSYWNLGDDLKWPHGSMCAGIIAGRPINGRNLLTAVAPRARLMVLRGMGYLKSYEYALIHGADVLSMSYMWEDTPLGHYRGVYRAALEHLSAAGVVAVGGAGNYTRLRTGKQIALPKDVPCVITAAGIARDGRKAPNGSEGPCTWKGVKFYDDYPPARPLSKPDVTGVFGKFPLWGRPENGEIYARQNDQMALIIGPAGNSFSGAETAGVAALMLSANPDLCPWEVKALMERTCRDLGPKGRDYSYGAGLLQARDAVRAARAATGQLGHAQSGVAAPPLADDAVRDAALPGADVLGEICDHSRIATMPALRRGHPSSR